MANAQPLLLTNDMLEKGQAQVVDLYISVAAGVPTVTPVGNALGSACLLGTSAAAPLDQTTIDAFIGASEIVAATAFSATALGVDSIGFVIDMKGQVAKAVAIESVIYLATPVLSGALASTSALTSSLSTAVAVTTLGNLYGRCVLTGYDAGTAYLRISVLCYMK